MTGPTVSPSEYGPELPVVRIVFPLHTRVPERERGHEVLPRPVPSLITIRDRNVVIESGGMLEYADDPCNHGRSFQRGHLVWWLEDTKRLEEERRACSRCKIEASLKAS